MRRAVCRITTRVRDRRACCRRQPEGCLQPLPETIAVTTGKTMIIFCVGGPTKEEMPSTSTANVDGGRLLMARLFVMAAGQ